MRYLSFITIATLFFIALQVSGQKHELRVSGEFSHPVHSINISGLPEYDYYGTKGLELGYFYGLGNDWQLGISGLYEWNTYYTKIDEKYDCNESAVGLLLKNTFVQLSDGKWKLLWTFGTYNGVVNNPQRYVNPTGSWIPKEHSNEGEKFFSDLYLDLELKAKLGNWGNASFAPFMKYRIKDNWLNEQFDGFQFGLKLVYSFGF